MVVSWELFLVLHFLKLVITVYDTKVIYLLIFSRSIKEQLPPRVYCAFTDLQRPNDFSTLIPLYPPPRYSPIFFLLPPPPLLSNPSMCVTCLGLFTRYFYFSRWLFFLVYRALSLSLPLYSSLYPPPPSLSLLCRVISGNGAAAMFCLPGAGLLQAWRVPCLRSGFRDYPLLHFSLPLSCFQVKPPAISRPTHTYRHHFALVMAGERR